MSLTADRRLPHDWFDGRVPDCVDVADDVYLETTYSFSACRATQPHAVIIERGAHLYTSSILDVAPAGRVRIGECSMLNGARLICSQRIEIGAFATISWNVMIMDSYRVPLDPAARRALLLRMGHSLQVIDPAVPAAPVTLHDNVWLGFDVCVLPGVTIGEGSIVGARSVVTADVDPYTVVAGNPARPIRDLPRADGRPTL